MIEGEMVPPTPDWSVGRYERTAERILPAAQVVVERASLQRGEHVLDLGCGTGNAALLAAARGTHVTGVDPASRLIDVARARADKLGADVTFLAGDAASLPVGDASVDAMVSVFAVIFAPDAVAAAAEMSRVVKPRGRIILSAWVPQGTLSELTSAAAEAVRQAVGAPAPQVPFDWHDPDALSALFAPYDFTVEVEHHSLSFVDTSPNAYLDGEVRDHPMAIAGLSVLERFGQAEALRVHLLQILEAGNEDPAGFQITSQYVVATAQRATE